MKYVVTVLALIAGLAQAQDQTVEGAQKFIASMAEEGALTVTVGGYTVSRRVAIDPHGSTRRLDETFSPDKVSSTMATSPCSTMFQVELKSPTVRSVNYTYRDRGGDAERMSEDLYHPKSLMGTRTTFSFAIDWAKIPSVEKKYGRSVSLINNDGEAVEIEVASNDYATRLHYAMEFLRIKCDKKSATGF